jgi:hypothetical protein
VHRKEVKKFMSFRHEPEDDIVFKGKWHREIIPAEEVKLRLRLLLSHPGPHPLSSEELPSTGNTEYVVPQSSWLTQRLGLSPKRLKTFVISRLLVTGEWLTAPQYEFLLGLVKEAKIPVSQEKIEAKERATALIKELILDKYLLALMQLLPPGYSPDLDFLTGLREEFKWNGFSTLLEQRTYMGLSSPYAKVLPRIVYIKKQRRVLREPRRRRSSEDSGGKPGGRSRGPLLVSQAEILTQNHSPWDEYPKVRDDLLRSWAVSRFWRTGSPTPEEISSRYWYENYSDQI